MPANSTTVEPVKPRRHRFQFRLRSLLVGLVLIGAACAYVRWQAEIVQARKTIKAKLYSLRGSCMTADEYRQWIASGEAFGRTVDPVPTVSWVRRWLGDEPVVGIYIPALATPADEAEISYAFPEAAVSHVQLMSNH